MVLINPEFTGGLSRRPKAATLADFVGRWLRKHGDTSRIVAGADVPYFGAPLQFLKLSGVHKRWLRFAYTRQCSAQRVNAAWRSIAYDSCEQVER